MIEARIGRHLAPPPDVRPTDVPIARRITRTAPDRELHLGGRTTSSRTKPSRDHAKGGPHDALYLALKERWIADAGLDDIEEEPAKQRDWKPVNPLFGPDNVVITPHAAYYSEEAIRTVRDFAAHEVSRVLTGQPPLSPVPAAQLAIVRSRHSA